MSRFPTCFFAFLLISALWGCADITSEQYPSSVTATSRMARATGANASIPKTIAAPDPELMKFLEKILVVVGEDLSDAQDIFVTDFGTISAIYALGKQTSPQTARLAVLKYLLGSDLSGSFYVFNQNFCFVLGVVTGGTDGDLLCDPEASMSSVMLTMIALHGVGSVSTLADECPTNSSPQAADACFAPKVSNDLLIQFTGAVPSSAQIATWATVYSNTQINDSTYLPQFGFTQNLLEFFPLPLRWGPMRQQNRAGQLAQIMMGQPALETAIFNRVGKQIKTTFSSGTVSALLWGYHNGGTMLNFAETIMISDDFNQ